ncbi:hypothetical protein [Streptomyces sp. B6B3]|uniref:hypothetical protein n=1 Tax=Streptomyces sp. B6B3 TaxID=3153570 RepID=UPI00325DA03F
MLTARQDAVETARALRAALARHEIVLPSLDVDLVSYAHFAGRPLIELGRVNNVTVNALVRVLNSAPVGKR